MSDTYTTCYQTHQQPRQCQAGNWDKCHQQIQTAKCPRRNVEGKKILRGLTRRQEQPQYPYRVQCGCSANSDVDDGDARGRTGRQVPMEYPFGVQSMGTAVSDENDDERRRSDDYATTTLRKHATCLLGIKDNRRNNLATNPIKE